MRKADVITFFDRLAAANPEPKGELEYSNPYTLLVAVVLSAQATDVGVNKATRELFAIADTPEKMLALGEEVVRQHIRTIGLFNTKAKNVIALSRILVEEHGSEVPREREVDAAAVIGRADASLYRAKREGRNRVCADFPAPPREVSEAPPATDGPVTRSTSL